MNNVEELKSWIAKAQSKTPMGVTSSGKHFHFEGDRGASSKDWTAQDHREASHSHEELAKRHYADVSNHPLVRHANLNGSSSIKTPQQKVDHVKGVLMAHHDPDGHSIGTNFTRDINHANKAEHHFKQSEHHLKQAAKIKG